MIQKRCNVPFTTFIEAPFDLTWGSSIWVKVYATNIMGDSLYSLAGNGAVITRISDPPINLKSDDGISNAVVIGMNWDQPPETGGLEILDYRLWYDQGTADWTILDYGIEATSYITSAPLIAGTWYVFKLEARNEAGFSGFSDIMSVYAAQVPDTVNEPTTTRDGLNIVIDWNEPNNQGAEILGYRILIRDAGDGAGNY